jgi:subtilase family serine protease
MRLLGSIPVNSTLALISLLLLFPWRSDAHTRDTRSASGRITETVNDQDLVSLPPNVYPLARHEFDQGAVEDARTLRRMLLLLQRSTGQETALQKFLDEQQDKSSPNYHAWLTPEQFGTQFGPTDADIQTVTAWLTSHGFTDIKVGAGRTVVEFSGNAASVRNAFHTEIHRYLVSGEEHIANASDPQIPAALKLAIDGIVSLHNFRKKPLYHLVSMSRMSKSSHAADAAGPENTFSCEDFLTSVFGAFPGQSTSCHALGPYDFATIYNVLPLWNATSPVDGTGQTIAIVARTNINAQDIADFRNLFGLPANPPQIILDGPDPGLVRGDETEADLDVEWSGAVAKGATIKLVVSESTETTDGVDLSALYIVDHNLASVMSVSYGQCELNLGTAGNLFYNNLWQQAAAQGITVFVSSGDNGSAGCDFELYQGLLAPQPAQFGLQVNGLASTPYNIAVGGTDFNDYFNAATYWNATSNPVTLQSVKSYIPETTWNDSCTNAFLENPAFPLNTNPEANCNNPNAETFFAIAIGGSGGKSNCTAPTGTTVSSCSGGYSKPAWQVAPGVPNDGKRDLPDVSLFASNGFVDSFYMMCETPIAAPDPCITGGFQGVGGTSVSSPAFAGLLALVNQKTGSRQGNVNHVLYSLAAKQTSSNCNSSTGPAFTCIFNDITSGTIATPCVTGSLNCLTSTSGDQIGILSGYQAGTGYDLATGLGSVNAANLINNWNSMSGTASTTALTLNGANAINITHGTPVSVAISVSPTSPQPTGLASLIATQGSGSFGFDTLTVSNGTASGTTNMLPGGASYNVQAHYAGDANYAGSDSNAVSVTITPEPSATNVRVATVDLSTGQVSNPNATSIPYGSVYLLRSDVTNTFGSTCFNSTSASLAYACPTGSVSFGLDGTVLGTGAAPLNSEGYTENKTVQLTTGPHSFQGSYSGDNSYSASSGTDSVTVTPAPTISYTHNLYPMPIGVPVGFAVGARTNNIGVFAMPMSGTCTIFDGSTQVPLSEYTLTGVIYPSPNSPYVWETLDCETTATFSGPSGTHVLTVNYSGDTNYAPSSTGPFSVDEVYPTQTTLTPSASTILDGQPLTLTAQILPSHSANSPPTGNVTFSVYNSPVGTLAVSNNQAQFTIPSLGVGIIPIGASYSGDTNYATSSATLQETVNPVSTSASVTSSSPTVVQGASVTFTARITPAQMGAAPVSGTVYLTANGIEIGNLTVSNNQAQAATSFPTPGSVQIQANYSGDANYTASSATFTEIVTAPPAFSVTSAGTTTQTVNAGQTATFTNAITVSALNGFSAKVTLSCSLPTAAANTTCSANPSTFATGSGTATVTVTTMARGVALPSLPTRRFYLRPQWLPLFLLILFLAILVLLSTRTRRQRFAGALPLSVLALILMLQTIGCGGGGSSSAPPPPPTGTPVGTYAVTVTGTSGNTAHAATLTIVVN